MADVNQQILEALEAGYGPEDILSHIKSISNDSPAHGAWLKNYRQNSMDTRAANPEIDMTPDITNPNDIRVPPVMTRDPLAKPVANNQAAPAASGNIVSNVARGLNNWYQETPAWQIAAELGGGAATLYAAQQGIRAGINQLFPDPAVKVQTEQNKLKAQELEIQRQRMEAGASGELSQLEQARIETEKARAEQIRANIARQAKLDEMKAAQAAQPKLSMQEQKLLDLANAQAAAKANMAPPAPAGVVPSTSGLNAGIVPSAAGQVPNVETPVTPTIPEPSVTAVAPTTAPAPVAPVTTESKLPNLPTAKSAEDAMILRNGEPISMSALTSPEALERAKVVLNTDRPLQDLQLINQRGGISSWEAHAILGNQGMPVGGGNFGPPIPVSTPAAEVAPVTPVAPTPETPKAAVSPEPEKLTKEQRGMKNHLVSMYGGGPEGEAAYAKVKEIFGYTPEYPSGKGGGLTAEQTKIIKDWRKANIEGPKVNLTNDMKKALKSGTGLAILAAIPGFAEAASNKDFGKMTDIATDFLVLPFAQSREVGEGEMQALAKARYEGMVGGGRGITPAQAYIVGAGRGVAPPSAYRR